MRPRSTPRRIRYIRELFAPETPLLAEVNRRIETDMQFPIQIGAEEGKFLQFLIQLGQVKTIVEIGTLAGYSTIWMADALPEDGHIYTIERDVSRAIEAEKTFRAYGKPERVTLLKGSAHDRLPDLSDKGPFDMIFIDADKISYPAYLDWAEANVRSGGLIVGDNSFLFDSVYKKSLPEGIRPTTHEAMKSFNQRLADPTQYMSIMLPTKEGITLAIKR